MLKDEILELLELFDSYKISEENQRRLFENGVYFDFTYGDPDPTNRNKHLDVFGFGMLLKTCKALEIEINVNELIRCPWNLEYEHLVDEVAKAKKSKIRRLKQ